MREIVKVSKVTSNDSTELIYIPKQIREALGLKKGTYVIMRVESGRLVIEKLNVNRSEGE